MRIIPTGIGRNPETDRFGKIYEERRFEQPAEAVVDGGNQGRAEMPEERFRKAMGFEGTLQQRDSYIQ